MNKFNLIAITTDNAFDRHLSIFNIYKLISKYFDCRLLLVSDLVVQPHLKFIQTNYKPYLWGQCLFDTYPIFLLNAQALQHSNDFLSILQPLSYDFFHPNYYLFPQRKLSKPEMDVIAKHYVALKTASVLESPSLIVEDDVILNPNMVLSKAIDLLQEVLDCTLHTSDPIYHDISTYYCYHNFRASNKANALSLRVSLTKTLCSYAVNTLSARQLALNFAPFALPGDMHIQWLLHRLSIGGGYLKEGIFINGSLSGHFKSKISPPPN